jgi:hypothetical protein
VGFGYQILEVLEAAAAADFISKVPDGSLLTGKPVARTVD